jgi:dTMP kinase
MARFVTFEGIEGSGKSTQLVRLAQQLKSSGHAVTLTWEPGGCPIADRVRAILLDAENSALTPMAELLLYAAARAQHVAQVVVPDLNAGHIVLCDRFTDATIAYQGYGRGLDFTVIAELNRLAAGGLCPDLTVLVDCPVEVGLARAMARINSCQGAREERFELESLQFHQRVRDGYLALAEREQDRFIVIDGAGSIAETEAAIFTALLPRLAKR